MNMALRTINAILEMDMMKIGRGIHEPLPKLFYELRYNENHDEKGRFTFGKSGGSSGKGVDISENDGIIGTGFKISMQFFGKKRAGIRFSKSEYGKVTHEINTEYYKKYEDKDIFVHRTVYKNTYYNYKVRNYGFDNYVFISRSRSK